MNFLPNGLLTLFVDASFCSETKAAGWGAWAKRADGAPGITFGGGFSHSVQPQQSHEAEIVAIANALSVLDGWGWLEHTSSMIVQSDCSYALKAIIQHVRRARPAKPKGGGAKLLVGRRPFATHGLPARAVKFIDELAERRGLLIQVRHVRAHQPGNSRQWVNRQCDEEAKRHMRAEREKRKAA